jgi:hypothetical protein
MIETIVDDNFNTNHLENSSINPAPTPAAASHCLWGASQVLATSDNHGDASSAAPALHDG